ncbi:uncharacterized protein LOC6731246 isoform X3 [Drosophila simulans]|uniref:Uncharacterized protein, isoform C n=1 Tax=Drosophila simulans TaxID=7240 RepID=A0A0J9TH58_DROSI|nr:uncharacterized protein LOC6731246 isoform X3 [Drosophila simulans]KMY88570.1 uncharacterized protein Dsimw501_GD22557, isoform C [Drosophila simulans]
MNLSQHFGRRVIAVRHPCHQLGALRHCFMESGREQLDSGHRSGTMADVAKKIREHVGVEGGYHIIPKSRDGLLKFQPKQDELPNRSMLDSQTTAQVLLETDALLRQRFVYGRGLLRMGRIIEELDLLAGNVDLPSSHSSAQSAGGCAAAIHFYHHVGGPRPLLARQVYCGCRRVPLRSRFIYGQ